MVTDLFGTILQELAHSMEIADLHPDRNNSCLIRLKNDLQIQLELDRSGEFMIIGSDLGDVPPGKYREVLFREALKANGMQTPLNGILAYSQKSNHLVIYEKLHIKDLNGEKIAAAITPFSEKANAWKDALARGEVPALNQVYSSESRSSGMFGLRP